MPNVVNELARTQHQTSLTRSLVSLVTVIPANSGPAAPPFGGSPSGAPTRPTAGQLWPRGDGVPSAA